MTNNTNWKKDFDRIWFEEHTEEYKGIRTEHMTCKVFLPFFPRDKAKDEQTQKILDCINATRNLFSETIDKEIKARENEIMNTIKLYISYESYVEGNPYDEKAWIIPESVINKLL